MKAAVTLSLSKQTRHLVARRARASNLAVNLDMSFHRQLDLRATRVTDHEANNGVVDHFCEACVPADRRQRFYDCAIRLRQCEEVLKHLRKRLLFWNPQGRALIKEAEGVLSVDWRHELWKEMMK